MYARFIELFHVLAQFCAFDASGEVYIVLTSQVGRYMPRFVKRHPCKDCTQRGRDFSEECRSCLLQKHLKCHVVPTIIYHNFHHHFLSIHVALKYCICKACGDDIFLSFSYGCKRCASPYHLKCAFLPLELKHKHGGYNHTMKLMSSHDGLEREEDYWCDVCYKDMDPQLWFYSCQGCPNYVAHLRCAGGYHQTFYNLKDVKYVEQVQSQLEEAIAEQGMPTRSELYNQRSTQAIGKLPVIPTKNKLLP